MHNEEPSYTQEQRGTNLSRDYPIMQFYSIFGVEHVYDAFDEYEHTNPLPMVQVKAATEAEMRAKAQHALSALVTETRRKGGFLSTGSFVAQIVEIRDASGTTRYEEKIEAPWGTSEPLVSAGGIWAYGKQTFIVPEEDTPLGPEESFEEDYRTIFTPDQVTSGVLALSWGSELITHLVAHPEELYSLSARAFEEFVANLLGRLYPEASIRLSPPGRDDGIDIALERRTVVGPEELLIQCKRYMRENKVGITVLKQLYADVNDRSATRGMVVTTSFFTKPALEYIRRAKYRLSGADFDMLRQWLASLSLKGNVK
jgi:restriction system protein